MCQIRTGNSFFGTRCTVPGPQLWPLAPGPALRRSLGWGLRAPAESGEVLEAAHPWSPSPSPTAQSLIRPSSWKPVPMQVPTWVRRCWGLKGFDVPTQGVLTPSPGRGEEFMSRPCLCTQADADTGWGCWRLHPLYPREGRLLHPYHGQPGVILAQN